MTNEELVKAYFKYLVSHVSKNEDICSCKLMWKLLTVEYKFKPGSLDENRSADAMVLRELFGREYPFLEPDIKQYLTGPCTMLEMLVALSKRIDAYVNGYPDNPDYGQWFWLMVNNLGLANQCVDPWYNDDLTTSILERFNNKAYKKNGEGGLFVIFDPSIDLRKYDIWLQFNIWRTHTQN